MGTGALTPGDRFDRLELTLSRIEYKLDSKADRSDLALLQADVRDLQDRGSRNAQEAVLLTHELEKRVQGLEANSVLQANLAANARGRLDSRTKNWGILLSVASLIEGIALVLVSLPH